MPTDKAKRETIFVGSLEIEGFMMPDGSYRMSQTQAAECIGKPEINARRFLDSKGIKTLLGKGYTPDTIEVEPTGQSRGQTRINALPLEVVTAFWVWQCGQGNKQAISLVMALATETLERRFDNAFGVNRTEDEYNQLLAMRIDRLQQDLEMLGEAYAVDDLLREDYYQLRQESEVQEERITQLEEMIRNLGGDPPQPPELP